MKKAIPACAVLLVIGVGVFLYNWHPAEPVDPKPDERGGKGKEEKKPPAQIPLAGMAKVVVHGRQKFFGYESLNGKKRQFIILELDKGVTIRAWPAMDAPDLHAVFKAAHQKEVAALKAKLAELEKAAVAGTIDVDQVTKAAEKVGKEFDRAIEDLEHYVAEGALLLVRQGSLIPGEPMQIEGAVRPYTPEGAHGIPARGMVIVEGKALPGKHAIGPDQHSPLAIENGKTPIIVTGELAKQDAGDKGMIRVTGKLLSGADGKFVLHTERLATGTGFEPLPRTELERLVGEWEAAFTSKTEWKVQVFARVSLEPFWKTVRPHAVLHISTLMKKESKTGSIATGVPGLQIVLMPMQKQKQALLHFLVGNDLPRWEVTESLMKSRESKGEKVDEETRKQVESFYPNEKNTFALTVEGDSWVLYPNVLKNLERETMVTEADWGGKLVLTKVKAKK